MHFRVLYIMPNVSLDDISLGGIEEEFGKKFCYDCGASTGEIMDFCDWFQIGGRWCDQLKAKKGIKGDKSWGNMEESGENWFSIVEIQDLLEPISKKFIYAVADDDNYTEDEDHKAEIIQKINKKEITGCVALIDCHD